MTETYTLQQIADALCIKKASAETRAARESWPYTERPVRGGRQRLFAFAALPLDVQTAIALRLPTSAPAPVTVGDCQVNPETGEILNAAKLYEPESLWANYQRAPVSMQAEAARKHKAAAAVARLVDGGTALAKAMREVSEQQDGIAFSSLERWWHKKPGLKHIPRQDWLAALLDGYVGRTVLAECSAGAWDWYKGQYLSRKKPSHADTYRRLEKIAEKLTWTIPAAATLARRLDAEVSPMQQTLLREGPEALARKLPVETRDRSHFAPGEAVNGDGLKFDKLWVRFPDGEVLNTTTVWFWQDLFSGRLLAYRPGKTENTDMFRLATYDLTAICAPNRVWVDNTRVAANKLMTAGAENRHRFRADPEDGVGMLLQLGMEPRFTNPDKEIGNPGAKPVERAFGIGGIHDMVATHPRFADRGYSSATAVDFAEFCEVLDEEVVRFNAQEGRRTRVCGGVRSYDQAWEEAIAKSPARRLTESQRRLLLLAREVTSVDRRTGVVKIKAGRSRLGVNTYWSEALTRVAGERVCVMFDPDRLSSDASIYNLDGRYLCDAQHRPTQAFDSVEAGREAAKFKRRLVKATKAAADAQTRMTALERAAAYSPAANETPQKPARKPTGKVVKGHFQRVPEPGRDRQDKVMPKVANGDTVDDRFTERMKVIAEAHFAKTRI